MTAPEAIAISELTRGGHEGLYMSSPLPVEMHYTFILHLAFHVQYANARVRSAQTRCVRAVSASCTEENNVARAH